MNFGDDYRLFILLAHFFKMVMRTNENMVLNSCKTNNYFY